MSKRGWMRGQRRAAAAVTATIVAAVLSVQGSASACDVLTLCPSNTPEKGGSASVVSDPNWLAQALNTYRVEQGLPRLSSAADLDRLAQRHSQRMAREARVYHNRADLRRRNAETGETLGENVASGYDLQAIHRGFVASPSHRRTMLGSFQRFGLGVTKAKGEFFVVEVFASDRRAAPRGAPAHAATPPRASSREAPAMEPVRRPVPVEPIFGVSADLSAAIPTGESGDAALPIGLIAAIALAALAYMPSTRRRLPADA